MIETLRREGIFHVLGSIPEVRDALDQVGDMDVGIGTMIWTNERRDRAYATVTYETDAEAVAIALALQ